MIKLARNFVLPVAIAAALFACDKGKGGSGGGPGATGAAGASAIAPAQGGLKRALAAMPKETELIVGIDFQSLRKSAVFKKYEPQIMEKVGKDLAEFKQKCGFDPMEKLTGLLFGAEIDPGGSDGGLSNGTFFVRGFEKGPAIECIKKAAAEKAAEGDSANIDGDYIELLENGTPKFRALFIDDTTALFIKKGDTFADKAGLQAAAAAKEGEGLTASAAFVKLLDEVKTGSSMFVVMNGNAKVMQSNPLPFKIKAIFAWVNVGGGVDGESRIRMEDADAASAMVGFYKMGIEEVKKTPAGKFIDSVKVSSKGTDVVASFKFDQKQIDEMVEMAKSGPF
ncbi:MAG TPA: hypothetical protein VM261_30370 [Kofleriaceae bacterium]|nr:hypothetical protein [Kofleriaceae bacterium]